MADEIRLEPALAGQTLMEIQNMLRSYLAEIDALAEILRAVSAITFSTPITEVLIALANALTEIGNAVNEGVNSYAQAFVEVVERWKQTDATAASAISFAKPGFEGVHVTGTEAYKVDVQPPRVRQLMEQEQHHGSKMGDWFSQMTEQIQSSNGYWIGNSGDHTRQTWMSKLIPLSEQVMQLMQKVYEMIGAEVDAIIQRDSNSYVN